MKVHPNGTLEGTPSEISIYQQMQHEQSHSKPFKDIPVPISKLPIVPVTRVHEPVTSYITIQIGKQQKNK